MCYQSIEEIVSNETKQECDERKVCVGKCDFQGSNAGYYCTTPLIHLPTCIFKVTESRYSYWLLDGRLSGRSSSPGRVKNFHFSVSRPDPLCGEPLSYQMDTVGSLTGGKAPGG
jgi:hypothetical protein